MRRKSRIDSVRHNATRRSKLEVAFCVHGVISPLLANLYMRRFVLGWKKLGLEQSLGSRIVTYADDLVILCRRGKAEEALARMREIMGKLKLTVNEDKTRICKVPEGAVRLPGLHVRADVFDEDRQSLPGHCGRRRRASGGWSRRSMTLTDLKTVLARDRRRWWGS